MATLEQKIDVRPNSRSRNQQDDNKSHNDGNHSREVKVVTAPNAVVDGRTISQWSQAWLQKVINTPAGAENGLNDPDGSVAAKMNIPHDPMFFITGAPSGSVRTFHVYSGQDVFLPIRGGTDAEGPGINPTIPNFVPAQGTFADEVRTVLNSLQFSDITLSIDGKAVTNLRETDTGIFSAGTVRAGTTAVDFFGAVPGASLSTTGQRGYFAVLDHLSEGAHEVVSTGTITQFGHAITMTHTDIIKVD